jgi:hypothetical protein
MAEVLADKPAFESSTDSWPRSNGRDDDDDDDDIAKL